MPVGGFSVEVIDLSGMTAELRAAAEAEHLDRTQSTPFDLEADSILRATLIRHDHHRHVLSLVNHHIASDRWSTTIMLREIAAGYRQLAGTGPPLAPPPVQYRDFAAWQRERFADPADNDGADRWAKRFSERGASLDPIVPAGAAPTPGQEPKHVALGVPPETVAGLVDRAARSDATLFMVVLAALASAIRNHTDTASITVGSLFSGRTRQEFENLIGYFANVVPLTCEFPRNGHRAALEAAREATSQGFRHADIPFEYLVRRVNPRRIPGRLPMIDALLSFAEPGPNQFQLGPARARRRRQPSGMALAPIDITLRHEGAELTGAMLIDPSLVDGAVAASIAERFVAELELLAHPTEPGG